MEYESAAAAAILLRLVRQRELGNSLDSLRDAAIDDGVLFNDDSASLMGWFMATYVNALPSNPELETTPDGLVTLSWQRSKLAHMVLVFKPGGRIMFTTCSVTGGETATLSGTVPAQDAIQHLNLFWGGDMRNLIDNTKLVRDAQGVAVDQ